jgi:hypothetical protein
LTVDASFPRAIRATSRCAKFGLAKFFALTINRPRLWPPAKTGGSISV